jgi:hypothetical protein
LEPSNRHIFIISTTVIIPVVERILVTKRQNKAQLGTRHRKVPQVHFSLDLLNNSHQRCSLDLTVLGTAMQDQRVSFQRKKRRRRFFAHRCPCKSSGFLEIEDELRKLVGVPTMVLPRQPHWCGTDYGTPMTTPPLCSKGPTTQKSITVTWRWEANLDDSGIFLPALDKGPTNILMERRKTSYPRRQTRNTQPVR